MENCFLVEYFGPFIFHPLFYYVQSLYGSGSFEHTQTQNLPLQLSFCILKRELETIFVHKFSNATMPAFNIFKNSGHYWILSGFNLAYFIYGPSDKLGVLKYFSMLMNYQAQLYMVFSACGFRRII